jgi:RNA-splicing ligase RtcB
MMTTRPGPSWRATFPPATSTASARVYLYRKGVEELRRTPVGSVVVCGDRQLLFEEAPTAYKRIEQVIADLVDHDLATPVATTMPLVTYKTPDRRTPRRGR